MTEDSISVVNRATLIHNFQAYTYKIEQNLQTSDLDVWVISVSEPLTNSQVITHIT